MPLIFNREVDNTTRVGLWRIDETWVELKEQLVLDPSEEIRFASFKSEIRRKQWLSYRILLKRMLSPDVPVLEYDTYGKPCLKNSGVHLSIAHSGEYSAVITSRTTPVGIDIERLKDRIFRIRDRFLSPEEDSSICEPNLLEKLYVAWGAKEALYKIHGKPEVGFRGDIIIDAFDYLCSAKGQCTAGMKTPGGFENYDIFYERISDYMLVYAWKRTTGNEEKHP
jgi:4'-phosphopantetheinyl transferase